VVWVCGCDRQFSGELGAAVGTKRARGVVLAVGAVQIPGKHIIRREVHDGHPECSRGRRDGLSAPGVDGVRELGLAFGLVNGRVGSRGRDDVGACGAQRRLDCCQIKQIELRSAARDHLRPERRRALHKRPSHLASASGHHKAHRHPQQKRSGESASRG
jgi:hypothetical protein